MKKNATKILMAALALIMAIGIATGTTFAWFSLNQKVAVTGMQVTTQVKNNIQIAQDTLASTSKLSSFQTNYLGTTVEDALLEPVSTVDGDTFFYNSTLNVKASNNGDAIADNYIAYDPADTAAFNSNYQTSGAKGYIDYVFQLSATNTHQTDSYDIRVTALQLLYNGAATGENAFRVAMFVEDISSAAPAGGVGTLKTILMPAGGDYFTDDQAVDSVSSLDDVTELGEAATIATLTHGVSGQYKVVVRLWLEGEDESCDNETFATLTNEWSLNMTIELVATAGGTAAVTAIGNTNSALTAELYGASVAAASNDLTIDGVVYHKIDSVQLGSADLYTPAASITDGIKVYTVADGKYLTEVTNQMTYTAP